MKEADSVFPAVLPLALAAMGTKYLFFKNYCIFGSLETDMNL